MKTHPDSTSSKAPFPVWYRDKLASELRLRGRDEDIFSVIPLGALCRSMDDMEAFFALVTLLLTLVLLAPMIVQFFWSAAAGDLGRGFLAIVMTVGLNCIAIQRVLSAYKRESRGRTRLAFLRGEE